MMDELEKYFIGFNFTDKEHPLLVVGKHDGKNVVPVSIFTDKNDIAELYKKLIGKEAK
jgi:hypothetical protein